MCSKPTGVLVKDVIMYPAVGKSAANCGIGIVVVNEDLSTFPVAVPTLICEAILLGGPCGTDGVM